MSRTERRHFASFRPHFATLAGSHDPHPERQRTSSPSLIWRLGTCRRNSTDPSIRQRARRQCFARHTVYLNTSRILFAPALPGGEESGARFARLSVAAPHRRSQDRARVASPAEDAPPFEVGFDQTFQAVHGLAGVRGAISAKVSAIMKSGSAFFASLRTSASPGSPIAGGRPENPHALGPRQLPGQVEPRCFPTVLGSQAFPETR
jgi:hypothetical protein